MRLRVAKRLLCGLLLAVGVLLLTALLGMSARRPPSYGPPGPTPVPSIGDILLHDRKPVRGVTRPPQDEFTLPKEGAAEGNGVGPAYLDPAGPDQIGPGFPLPPEQLNGEEGVVPEAAGEGSPSKADNQVVVTFASADFDEYSLTVTPPHVDLRSLGKQGLLLYDLLRQQGLLPPDNKTSVAEENDGAAPLRAAQGWAPPAEIETQRRERERFWAHLQMRGFPWPPEAANVPGADLLAGNDGGGGGDLNAAEDARGHAPGHGWNGPGGARQEKPGGPERPAAPASVGAGGEAHVPGAETSVTPRGEEAHVPGAEANMPGGEGHAPAETGVTLAEEYAQEADSLWNLVQAHTRAHSASDQPGQASGRSCAPKQHVFFGKVHKTGSSTVANILQRYGFTRKLNFVLPRKRIHSRSYNYISIPGVKATREKLIPPPLGEHYDILWNHAIYESGFYHQVMPQDTVFISILRQPLQQFQSTFEYYGHVPGSFLYSILQTNISNPLTLYLQNHSLYENPDSYTSYLRNKQAQDLGMRNVHVIDAARRRRYLRQLDEDFQLVIITELFDESLVLLRRLLCWRVKDVLYIPKNKNGFKKQREFSAQDEQAHRELSVADYELYDFFLDRLNRTIAAEGPDFEREVRYFKAVLRNVQNFCVLAGGEHVGLRGRGSGERGFNGPTLKIGKSRWTEAFRVTLEDCRLMQKHELIFLDDLVVDAIRRYLKSVSQKSFRQS